MKTKDRCRNQPPLTPPYPRRGTAGLPSSDEEGTEGGGTLRPSDTLPMSDLSLMIVAGERSGDLLGAELARALRERLAGLQLFGCGGDAMREAGVETVVDAHRLTMMGITEVISGLPRAYRALRALVEEAERRRPQLAVLIDFPDFNLRLAKRLKQRGIRVVYFVSPQIWAWRKGRLRQLKARIEKMLCIFDFEEAIYRKAGIPVEYVGHPMVDLVRPKMTREEFFARIGLDPSRTTVALLPGSRAKEVSQILPTMLEAARRISLNRKLQFVVAVAPTLDAGWVEKMLLEHYGGALAIRVATHATYDTLRHCDVAVVASGTATLEAALCERPMVVVYRLSRLTYRIGRLLVKVPFYSMVNILAGKQVVPELIQSDFTPAQVSSQVEYLLDHSQAREEMAKELRAVKERLGSGGAVDRAAEAVVALLRSGRVYEESGVRSQESE
jgi:lipid-A-disaccharide synthase